MTTKKERERAESIENLRQFIKPGMTIYCVLRSVSRSGMRRVISFYTIEGEQRRIIDYHMGRVLDLRPAEREGVKVSGCGSDMGFECVYNLGRYLFPDGFGTPSQKGHRAKSAADAKSMRKRGFKFQGRNADKSGWDNDGGYALKHVWL